jgi:hypothetical protein
MTAQVKTLAAPTLKEAVKGVLHIGKLQGNAHGHVPPNPNFAIGDTITFVVETSTGNTNEQLHALTAAELGRPVVISIPKDVFEKNLKPGATAELFYTWAGHDQTSETSPHLKLKLEK